MKIETAKAPRSFKSFSFPLFAAAFGLNWIWEIGQMFAYRVETEKSVVAILFFCTLGGIVDALTISAIYAAVKRLFNLRDWKFYSAAALLGAACAILFEKIAFVFGWWSYNERMPRVPFIGTGLFPFVQLTLLAPLAIWIAERRSQANVRK